MRRLLVWLGLKKQWDAPVNPRQRKLPWILVFVLLFPLAAFADSTPTVTPTATPITRPTPAPTTTPTYRGLASASRINGVLRPVIPDEILFSADCAFDYAEDETSVVISVFGWLGLNGIKAYTSPVNISTASDYRVSNAQVILDNAPDEVTP